MKTLNGLAYWKERGSRERKREEEDIKEAERAENL
jgi:hypothetical protein